MSDKFEREVLLSIKREFSQTEKHSILMKSYKEMEDKLAKYKEQMIGLQHNNHNYKQKYAELQNKYVKLCKKYSIEEYEIPEKL